MEKELNSNEYISLTEASKLCAYSQEYLSLRARQKKLKAVKMGRNWVTTQQWLEEYVRQAKGEEIEVIPAVKIEKPQAEKPAVKIEKPQVEKPKIRKKVPLTDFFRHARTNFGIKLGRSLEKIVGQPMDIGLALFDKITQPLLSLARGVKNITLLAGQKLSQPKFVLTAILISLLIISSILLNSPSAQTSLVFWGTKSTQFLVTASQKLSNFIFKQSQNVIHFTQEVPGQVERGVLWPTLAEIKSIGTISQKTINYCTQQVPQLPQKAVNFYQTANQKNEQAKLAVKLKIYQLTQASPRLIEASARQLADSLKASPAKIGAMLTKISQAGQLLANNLAKGVSSLPEKIASLLGHFQEKKEIAISILEKSPQYASGVLARLADTLVITVSDTIPDTLRELSDTGKNLGQKIIIGTQDTGLAVQLSLKREAASFLEIVTHLNQEISQGWNEFAKSIPQLPQEAKTALKKIKSKLGEAYLKIVDFFEGKKGSLVYRPKEIFNSIDELEESIIEDIQVRFAEFRGDLKTADQEKEGVIIVPLEEDEEEARRRMEELGQAFSDEVAVEPDETGKAGIIQPIFREDHLQKYLYMMVPVQEVEAKEK